MLTTPLITSMSCCGNWRARLSTSFAYDPLPDLSSSAFMIQCTRAPPVTPSIMLLIRMWPCGRNARVGG